MSLIGLDIGASGCKTIVFSEEGKILGQCHREYSILHPQPGWFEQDAERVWQMAWDSLEDAIADAGRGDSPTAMAISVQSGAIIPVDRSGFSMRYAILGMDARSIEENQWLEEQFGAEELYNLTGAPLHPSNMLPKLLWLQRHEPELWKQTDYFVSYEDFLLRRFLGKPIIGHCLASCTRMYDLAKGQWAEDILDKCGIDVNRLAALGPETGGVMGTMRLELATELGVHHNDIKIVSGGSNHACAAIGCGAIKTGSVVVSTAIDQVVATALETPALNQIMRDGNIAVSRHAAPGLYLAMSSNLNSGLLLRWFRDSLCEPQVDQAKQTNSNPCDLILVDAKEGPTGLMVLPHFAGSGTPQLDAESKGAILGLTLSDNRSTIAKAILEGLSHELRINLDWMRDGGIDINKLHVAGDSAKNPLWLQIQADICQIPLSVPDATETSCLGAALLAGTGAGVYTDLDSAISQTVKQPKLIEPKQENAAAYNKTHQTYKKIYPAINGLQKEL
jgi:xylulokinase